MWLWKKFQHSGRISKTQPNRTLRNNKKLVRLYKFQMD